MQLKLIDKQNLEKDIYLFTFEPQGSLTWVAGQQMVFTLEHPNPDNLGIKRTLSIASAPFEKNVLVLTHSGEHASTFKKALREMEVGEMIEGGEPEGQFVINDSKKEYTLIASGIGIAAYRAILIDMDHNDAPMNIVLIYSHTSENFPFKEEIERLVARHDHFKVFYTVDPTEVETGRIKEAIVGMEDHPIYMSGIYIRKIAMMLDDRDTSPKHLVHEGKATRLDERKAEIQEEEAMMRLWGE